MRPVIIINFKTYQQGEAAVKLAKDIQKASKDAIIGVQATDIYRIAHSTNLKVYAEHADFHNPGRNTGFILPEAVKSNNGKGVFLNHSEHRLDFKVIKETARRCREVGLKTAVFAASLKEAQKIKKINPDYLIIEPSELVAGDVSVSKAKPFLIKKIAEKLNYPFLVGAGIKNSEDVKTAMRLGAKGIAVSSAITKAKDPGKKLKELLN